MGVQKTEVVSTSPVPAGKMYHGLLIDMDNVVPKALPNAFKSVEILEGDGGVGTVKHVALGEVSQFNTMKLRIDAIDKEELTFSYSIIGGDILFDFIESIVNHFTVVPTANGGCTVKNTTIFTTKGDVVIPEENIKQATEQSKTIYNAVDTYLLAN